MFERLGAGAMARLVRDPADGSARAEDYEAMLAPIYAWIHAVAQNRTTAGRARHRRGIVARVAHAVERRSPALEHRAGRRSSSRSRQSSPALNRAGLGPLQADISGPELRRAGAAGARPTTLRRLGVRAPHVIFGHTHRAGPPVPTTTSANGARPTGSSLINTGCWVYERVYLGRNASDSPYRPGFCAVLDDDGPPVLSNLLDGVVPFENLRSSAPAERMSR